MTRAPKPDPRPDEPGPVEEGIEIALSNIVRMARMIPGSLGAVTNRARPELIGGLTQSVEHAIHLASAHLERFGTGLSDLGMPTVALSERARARTILLELRDWMSSTRLQRSLTNAPRPAVEWVVPPVVLERMEELAGIGGALRGTWIEVKAASRATARPVQSSIVTTSRVYLMYRDWIGYPEWFEVAKVNAADDEELPQRMVSYVKARLKKIDKATCDAFINGGGLTNLEERLASGDRRTFPRWLVFGWTDTDVAAAAVIALVNDRVRLALTYSCLPRRDLPTDRWAMLEREVGELNAQIREHERDPPPIGWTRFGFPSTRQRLRMESDQFAKIVSDAPEPATSKAEPKHAPKSAEPAAGGISHADDFSWLIARGDSYKFTTTNQRLVIEALFSTWEASSRRDGHGLSEAAIAAAIGTPSTRLRVQRLFEKSKALGRIIANPAKGMWALYLLAPPPKQS